MPLDKVFSRECYIERIRGTKAYRMADTTKITIAKLNSENYFTWKYKLELLLIKENLYSILNETKPELDANSSNQREVADWQRRDDQARSIIGLLVEDNQLCHIRTKTTASATLCFKGVP